MDRFKQRRALNDINRFEMRFTLLNNLFTNHLHFGFDFENFIIIFFFEFNRFEASSVPFTTPMTNFFKARSGSNAKDYENGLGIFEDQV